MKIAIDVTPTLPGGENGGIKQLLWELLKWFGQNAKSDKFFLLTSYRNDQIFKEFDKYKMKRICVIKNPSSAPIYSRWRIGRQLAGKIKGINNNGILKRNNVNVLFCPFSAPTYSEAGIPTISIVTDLQHLYYPFFFTRQQLRNRNMFYEQLKKKVDSIIAISAFTRTTIIEKLNIPGEKVHSVEISVQSRLALTPPAISRSILEKHNLDDKTYCIYPANFWPHKNHPMLISAFNLFQKRNPQLELHLVLTGADVGNNKILTDSVNQMKLSRHVHFTGYLSEEELSVLWQHAHFLIYPSLFEGFGIPLVEAMKYKKPVLASNVTSIPEVAGDAALYFDPKKPEEIFNSITRITTDNSLYQTLVQKGQERLKKFNYKKMATQYIGIIHQLGKGKKPLLKKNRKNKTTITKSKES